MGLGITINNLHTTLAAAYLAGSGSLVLQPGAGASCGSPTPTNFLRVTLITAATYGLNPETLTIFKATGVSGDTLTGVVAIEGTTDRGYGIGDVVEGRMTAATVSDLNTLATSNAATIATVQAAQVTDEANIAANTTAIASNTTAIGLRALDSAVVHVTGVETIAGAKTFSSTIVASISGNAATATALQSTLAIGGGGTGQTTATAALNALLPAQTGNATKALTTDGTNASWTVVAGGGSMTIGGAVGSSTIKGVLYVGAGGVLAEDATNLVWDYTNHRLGIAGTPAQPLHVFGVCDGSADGPLMVSSVGTGVIGTALTLDATSETGGARYSFISTGALAAGGAGDFAIFAGGVNRYVGRFNNEGQYQCSANGYGVGYLGQLTCIPFGSAVKGVVVAANAGQTGNLFEARDPGNAVGFSVDGNAYLKVTTSAGAPTSTPADGALNLDTTNGKLYCRTGGAWKSVTLT